MSYDLTVFEEKAIKTLEHFESELKKLRTGKAHAQLLDNVRVEAYGATLNIQEVATITVPDANLLVIKPYDKNQLEALEKAISTSDLNISPIVAGDIIRVVIPPLTEERRKDMVKVLGQKLEQGRVMLRNIRSETKREIERQKDLEGISEDDIKNDLDELEKNFKSVVDQLESIGEAKKKDLLTI